MTPPASLDEVQARLVRERARDRRRLLWLTALPTAAALVVVGAIGWASFGNPADGPVPLRLEDPLLATYRATEDSLAFAAFAEAALVTAPPEVGQWRDSVEAAYLATLPDARVFVHVPSDERRSQSDAISSALDAAGLRVQSTEVLPTVPDDSAVLFYHPGDAGTARQIQALAEPTEPLILRDLSDAPTADRVRPGTFEIWLSRR